jgi:hypothetical protein
MKYYILDKDGNYLGLALDEPKGWEYWTNKPPTGNFLKHRFDGENWIEGATEQEIKDSIVIPEIITRRQFKIALAFLGYDENEILIGINQLSEPTRTIANISYKEAGTFERSNPELIFVAKTFLQLTDEQIDEIFMKGNEF